MSLIVFGFFAMLPAVLVVRLALSGGSRATAQKASLVMAGVYYVVGAIIGLTMHGFHGVHSCAFGPPVGFAVAAALSGVITSNVVNSELGMFEGLLQNWVLPMFPGGIFAMYAFIALVMCH